MPELPPLADDVRASLPLTAQAYIAALEASVATLDALDTALARIAALQAEVESLTKQVAELQARLKQTSQNSSRPPSSDPPSAPPRAKKLSRSERKRGGQSNHPGHHRPLKAVADVDVVQEHWPPTCPKCQSALPKVAADGIVPLRQQVWEVPEVKPTVTEHRYEAVCCPTCQTVVRAKRPAEVPAGAFGPRLVSLVGLLVGRYRLSQREAGDLLADAFGVEMSDGSVAAACGHVSAALAMPYQTVQTVVERAAHAHVDETGWKQAGQRRWVWVAVATLVTLFRLSAKRDAPSLRQLLGADYRGHVISDRYRVYLTLPLARRQICWAHLKRDLVALSEAPDAVGVWGQRALAVEGQLFALWHRLRTGEIDRSTLQAAIHPLREQFTALLVEGESLPWPKAQSFCIDVQKLEPALWTFVFVAGIEPTNNAAERALRPAVLWRKGSFGSDSEVGLRFVERILTVAMTCRQQQRHLLTFLTDALTAYWSAQPPPSLLPTP